MDRNLLLTGADDSLLTVGIPTYNRKANISALVDQVFVENLAEGHKFLIIDDGGSDGTYDALASKLDIKGHQISLFRNEQNLGYTKTFCRIFRECDTDYLIMMADDDALIPANFPKIWAYIRQEKPDFISTQYFGSTGAIRKSRSVGAIQLKHFFGAAAHAPGLVYRVEACRDAIEQIELYEQQGNAAARLYPQVLLLLQLLNKNAKCMYADFPVVLEGDAQPSGLMDTGGAEYWALESRWRQLKGFDDFIRELPKVNEGKSQAALLNANRARVFGHIVVPMLLERPDMRAAFDKSARIFYIKQMFKYFFGFFGRR